MPPSSLYPPVAWNADDKRLVKEIFTILKVKSTIRKGIWPRKGENSGGKSKISHFNALARKLFQGEAQIKDLLKEDKAVIHYGTTVKNQVARHEKGCKRGKETLGVTGAGLPHEDDIHEGSYIMDKWHNVWILCPWFYQMKHLVDDRFDDIGAAITNSGEDIDLDAMNTNQKTFKSATPLPPSQSFPDPSQAIDDENEEKIEWEKTDDEDQEGNIEQSADTSSLRNTPQPRSATPHSQGTGVTPTVGSVISRINQVSWEI